MLAGILVFTVMFAIMKKMVGELPIFVVVLMRNLASLAIMSAWAIRAGPLGLATHRLPEHFYRSFLGMTGFMCLMYAFGHLIFADAMVLSFTSPLWLIVLSAIFLGEVVRMNRTIATLVGFVGVVFIVKPLGGIEPAMLMALASALLGSSAMIFVKRMSTTEPASRIVFYFFLIGTFLVAGPAIYTWQTPSLVELGWLAGAGIFAWLGQNCQTRAYGTGDVTVVAPMDYVRLPLAALLGFFWFDEIPDIWTGAGTTLIIVASLYIARREARTRRAEAATG